MKNIKISCPSFSFCRNKLSAHMHQDKEVTTACHRVSNSLEQNQNRISVPEGCLILLKEQISAHLCHKDQDILQLHSSGE